MAAPDTAFRQWVDQARDTSVLDVCNARPSIRVRGTRDRTGPCPKCGGHDRFSINTHKNVFRCRGCRSEGGGPIDLVMWLDEVPFLAAVESLTGRAPPSGQESGLSVEAQAEAEATRVRNRAERDAASAQWSEAERVRVRRWYERAKPAPGSPVESYLTLRGVALPPRATLRFHPSLQLWDQRRGPDGIKSLVEVHRGPAMLGAIRGPDGNFAALHMTWIDLAQSDGKVMLADPDTGELTAAKKIRGSKRGGRIELVRPDVPLRLFLGEGIETTLSVWQAMRLEGTLRATDAFWAAIDLGNLGGPHVGMVRHPTLRRVDSRGRSYPVSVESDVPDLDAPAIPIPDSVVEVVTLGDGDSDPFVAKQAHTRAATRWVRPGRRTVRAVFAPPGTDFNNLIRAALP